MKLSWANRITILRILLTVPFVICMLKINDTSLSSGLRHAARYASFGFFIVMALSDALDGYLARRNNQITRLGAFLDPIADKLLITCACLLLASSYGHVEGFRLPVTVVVLIIGKDLFILIGFVLIYLITSKVRIAPAFAGKTATALQLSMVSAILIAPEVSEFFPWWMWFLRSLWWSAAGMAVLSTIVYFRAGTRYIEQCEQDSRSAGDGKARQVNSH